MKEFQPDHDEFLEKLACEAIDSTKPGEVCGCQSCRNRMERAWDDLECYLNAVVDAMTKWLKDDLDDEEDFEMNRPGGLGI